MKTRDPKKSTTEVRQADHRHTNLRILLWSTVVVSIVLVLLYMYYVATAPTGGG